MKPILFPGLLLVFVFAQCARRCPSDISLGNMDLQPATKAFLPAAQQVQEMVFKNAAGETLVFTNNNPDWAKRFQLDVETLCERGDFLDRTVQTRYFNAETFHFYYATPNQDYTLQVDLMPANAGTYGAVSDTLFYETCSVYGQRIKAPTQVGGTTVLTSLRGNDAKISPAVIASVDNFTFVADTTLNGRTIPNAYVTPKGKNWTLFVFYTKTKGIEAFTTENGEVWLRE